MRQFRSVHLGFEYRLVDPGLLRHDRRVWPAAEPLGVGVVGGGESVLPGLVDRAGSPEMDRGGGVPRGVPRDPGMTVDVVVLVEEAGAELPGVGERGEGCRNSGRYLRVLNCASEYGLSLLTWGREWERVTPGSASSAETGLEVIEVPRGLSVRPGRQDVPAVDVSEPV
jgi:hypothetical protein